MPVPVLPESAPFTSAQRAWLNGFFAGVFGLEAADTSGQAVTSVAAPAPAAPAIAEDFPWHDPTLPLAERLELAQERPAEQKLMAAMAQLDCGSCGYLCHTYAAAIANGTERDLTRCTPGGGETAKTLKRLVAETPLAAKVTTAPTVAPASSPASSSDAPVVARLVDSRRLTHEDAAKDVRHVVIDLTGTGLVYEPGDSLGVVPINPPDVVRGIVRALGAEIGCRVSTIDGMNRSLGVSLATRCTLNRCTTELLQLVSQHAADAADRDFLAALDETSRDELLARVDVLDVLQRFPTRHMPLETFLDVLTPLRPRLYSISSSQRAFPHQVHLTVGVVRYEAQGKHFQGVASNFLGSRVHPGDPVQVFLHKSPGFRLPADPRTPIIMIGPGTGIAPFRAFLQERACEPSPGPSWLFFGNQHFHFDFLYRDELDAHLDAGTLSRLEVAFSRDKADKVYVQDRLLEHGADVWHWIADGAHIYVCGDAQRMARDVDRALWQIIAEQGGLEPDAAKAHLKQLAASGRYARDVY